MAKKKLDPDAVSFRDKARYVLAQADAAADQLIAAELRLLAERYLSRAVELDGTRPRRTRPAPRRREPQAGTRPSPGACRGDT